MTAKHTPGPWEVVADHSENACVHIRPINRRYGGDEVAVLYGFHDDAQLVDGVWGDQPIRDADARLIAAAPELLEALRGMLNRWTSANQNWTQAVIEMQKAGRFEEATTLRNTVLQALADFPVEDASAAIAKAEGLA